MSDKVSTSITLSKTNREYLDQEVNNRSGFINDLIEAHRQGKSDIDEAVARQRRSTLNSELHKIELREEEILTELDHIEQQIRTQEEQRKEMMDDAREALAKTPRDPENAGIQNWADKLDLTPEELLEQL